jgi:sec-independent protein translocase protein TatA
MLPNLGIPEMVVIAVIALIVFGPKKLPEMGKSVGNALREFNKARNDFMESIHSELDHDDTPHPVSTVSDTPAYAPATSGALPAPAERQLEYPAPLQPESADALPYGGDFHAAEGDSQPAFRTAHPEPAAVSASASMTVPHTVPTSGASAVEGKA